MFKAATVSVSRLPMQTWMATANERKQCSSNYKCNSKGKPNCKRIAKTLILTLRRPVLFSPLTLFMPQHPLPPSPFSSFKLYARPSPHCGRLLKMYISIYTYIYVYIPVLETNSTALNISVCAYFTFSFILPIRVFLMH